MMAINWKRIALVLTDVLLAVYLVLAICAFNNPDERNNVCSQVEIRVKDGVVRGFLNADAVKAHLQQAKLYPVGDLMEHVDVRRIEEFLRQNPLVESAECYKTQTGHVHITLTQRLPVIRVKADNGDDYYIDSRGAIMPPTRYASGLAVATGHVSKQYAQKVLARIGTKLINDPFWCQQVEQLNVLGDGSLELVPRVGDHIIYLGRSTGLDRKLQRLEKFYRYGLSKAGWNKYTYISLEFDNQIICKRSAKL